MIPNWNFQPITTSARFTLLAMTSAYMEQLGRVRETNTFVCMFFEICPKIDSSHIEPLRLRLIETAFLSSFFVVLSPVRFFLLNKYMLLLWWHDLFLFLCLFSFVSFVLRIKLKSDNGSALKKTSGKLGSLFFYQFQWYPLYGEFTVSKPHSSVKSVSIKIFKMSHIQIKHISTLDISIIGSMCVCYIHFSCTDWLFHIFLTNDLHFWHLNILIDWLD